jgi:hypothetical protein
MYDAMAAEAAAIPVIVTFISVIKDLVLAICTNFFSPM